MGEDRRSGASKNGEALVTLGVNGFCSNLRSFVIQPQLDNREFVTTFSSATSRDQSSQRLLSVRRGDTFNMAYQLGP